MTKCAEKVLSLFLAALMLCLTSFPAEAESAAAATMQLMKTEGTVGVTNSSGRGLTKRDNMRLYNGYHVETEAASYAWINLDDAKLAKLDAVSEMEVRKSGKKLELLVSSGDIFFNVTEPLEGDETLNIRTSTMLVGIRGTSGWIKVIDRWRSEIYVLEGTVQCSVTDPVTAQVKTSEIRGGEMAVALAYSQDREGDKCDIIQERYGTGDIDGFVLVELVQDSGLCEDIYEDSGLDVRNITEKTAQDRLEQDERQMQEVMDQIETGLVGQNNNVSTDPTWQEGGSKSGSSGSSGSPGSSGTTVPSEGNIFRPTNAAELLAALRNAADGTLITLAADINLNMLEDINLNAGTAGRPVVLDLNGHDLAMNGRYDLNVSGALSIRDSGGSGSGTLFLSGTIRAQDAASLSLDSGNIAGGTDYITCVSVLDGSTFTMNGGSLNGTGQNTQVVYLSDDSSFVMNDGVIKSSGVSYAVNVTDSSTFTMEGGTVDGGANRAVNCKNATFIIKGGTVTSINGFATVYLNDGGSMSRNGGTITNSGAGVEVYTEA